MLVFAWIFTILEVLCVPITAYCFLFSESNRLFSLSMAVLNFVALGYWLNYLILSY